MAEATRKPYRTDLTDEQWALLAPLLSPAKPGGRPRIVNLREVLNTLLYQARTSCQWDLLPHDLVPTSTAYGYFERWEADGTWQKILDALRGTIRKQAGRDETPSAACIDSQTTKSSEVGGDVGYDGGKKIKGIKKHIVVDTLGLLLAVILTPANCDDGTHALNVLKKLDRDRFPRLAVIFGDNKYNNKKLTAWLEKTDAPYRVEVVKKPDGVTGFEPVKIRWCVERTFAWLGRCRRLSKHYEYNASAGEAWVKIAAIGQMLRRIKPDKTNAIPPFLYPKKDKKIA